MAWILSCLLALSLALVVRGHRVPGPVGALVAAAIPFLPLDEAVGHSRWWKRFLA